MRIEMIRKNKENSVLEYDYIFWSILEKEVATGVISEKEADLKIQKEAPKLDSFKVEWRDW